MTRPEGGGATAAKVRRCDRDDGLAAIDDQVRTLGFNGR